MNELFLHYTEELDAILRPDRSFDMIKRKITLSNGHSAALYYIHGFVKDIVNLNLVEFLCAPDKTQNSANIPSVGAEQTEDIGKAAASVMSGTSVLCAEGLDKMIVIDNRQYPVRSIAEPENDKVLRGSRDGFTEALLTNTILIRRRVRDPNLVMKHKFVGSLTNTDIILCYIEGRADQAFVQTMEKKLDEIKIGALNMGQESLAECLIASRWYNPFPKIRYTERPDAAAAMLFEGSVLILCDNSPSVMLLPTSIFDFLQETDDFYFPPLIGSYLRLLRMAVFVITLIFTPAWYLLIQNPAMIPPWLQFVKIADPYAVPILLQLFIVEFAVDGLKLASLNTPSSLNSSLSIVGGLILGEFAVRAGWFVPQVILYMAFVAIANFTQSSYELGYAFKFMRMMLILFIALFNLWGFLAGLLLMIILIATNTTVDGSRSYLYPLIPFNARAFKRLILRVKLK